MQLFFMVLGSSKGTCIIIEHDHCLFPPLKLPSTYNNVMWMGLTRVHNCLQPPAVRTAVCMKPYTRLNKRWALNECWARTGWIFLNLYKKPDVSVMLSVRQTWGVGFERCGSSNTNWGMENLIKEATESLYGKRKSHCFLIWFTPEL